MSEFSFNIKKNEVNLFLRFVNCLDKFQGDFQNAQQTAIVFIFQET